jgi:hypothetical protein
MGVDVELALSKLGVKVRRKGGRIWAEECPLPTHGRPNPAHRWQNFFVRPEEPRLGQYHCYSCKGGGRLIELVMVLLQVDPAGAREWIANLGEVAPAPYLRVRFVPTGPGGRVFRLPAGVETKPLGAWPTSPLDYARSRGLTDEQVDRWRVGFAHEGRLAHRVVLPTFDAQGRLANYAARTFVGDEVRYLSADEREHPDKSALYGEHLWPRLEQRRCGLVFEGALNGLALERALARFAGMPDDVADAVDLPYLVGLSGSRFDHRKGAKMATFARLLVATDPDRAGEDTFDEIAFALRRRTEVVRFSYPCAGRDAVETPTPDLADALLDALRWAA